MQHIKPRLMQAIAWYPFNTSHAEIIEQVYGTGHHGNYIEEKLGILRDRGILWFYGQLDNSHRKVLCQLIENKYSDYLNRKQDD